MPKFRVTSPDGRTFDVNAPDGATQEQAIQYVQSQHTQPAQETAPEEESQGGILDFLKGIKDLPGDMSNPDAQTHYSTLLPAAKEASGRVRLAAPGIIQDAYRAMLEGGEAARGNRTPEEMMQIAPKAALATLGTGTAFSVLPKLGPEAGALTMNALTSKPVMSAAKTVSKGASAVAQPILDRLNPDSAIGRVLAKRVLQQNPGMSLPDAIAASEAKLSDLGPESVFADTGESMRRLGRTMIQNPGETAPRAADILGKRQAGEATRTIGSIEKNVSDKPFYDVDEANKLTKKQASPLYEKAYNENPSVTSDGLQLLLQQEPLVQQGINKGVELQRIEASTARQKFDPSRLGVVDFNEAGDPILGNVTPLRLWHAARQGLDEMVNAYPKAPNGKPILDQRGQRIVDLRKSISDEVKDLTGGSKGDFAQADKIYADASKLNEALFSGRSFARGDEEITEKVFKAFTPEQQEAYRSGVAREMVAMTRKSGATPKQIIDAVKDESGIRAKLQVILPTTKQFDGFVKDLENELAFRETNKLRGGSPTFSLGQEEADTGAEVLGHLGSIGSNMASGNHLGAVAGAMRWAQNSLKRAQMPQSMRDKIGKLIISKDPLDKAEAIRLLKNVQTSGWVYAP